MITDEDALNIADYLLKASQCADTNETSDKGKSCRSIRDVTIHVSWCRHADASLRSWQVRLFHFMHYFLRLCSGSVEERI
jgi:hypothetical protein